MIDFGLKSIFPELCSIAIQKRELIIEEVHRHIFPNYLLRITFAGDPYTIQPSSISFVTTDPIPTNEFFPT